MNQELQNWLKAKDFQKGIDLVEKYAPDDATLLRLLRSGKNSLTVLKLEKKINALLESSSPVVTIPQKQKAEVKPLPPKPKAVQKADLKPQNGTFDEDESTDPDVMALVANRKKLYVERTQVKAKLNMMVWEAKKFTNYERGIVGRELSHICKALKEVWEQVLYYRKYGKLPKPEGTDGQLTITNINDIYKRITVVRTYLTKIKNGILSDKKLHIYTAEMEQLNKQIADYETNNKVTGVNP